VKSIPGIEGYEADEDGSIWSIGTNWRGYGRRILAQYPDKSGYLRVRLVFNGRREQKFVHFLVCTAYHGLKPTGLETRHIDGNKLNNKPDNLSWGTHKENVEDRVRHGVAGRGERNGVHTHPEKVSRGESSVMAKLTESQVVEIRRLYRFNEKIAKIAKKFNVCYQTIRAIVRRITWKHIT
jgi:hypothetical protein